MRSAKNYLIVLLACTTVAAGLWAWHQTRELAALRGASPDDEARAALRRRIWNERQAATAAESGSPAGTGDEAKAGASPSNRGRRGEGVFQRILDNPDYQTLINLSQKGMLDGRYAALFKRLGLTPAQLEQFKELLVEKQSALMDVFAAARAQGLDPRTDRDAVRQLIATTQAEIDSSIRTAIGEAAYAEYQDYERTLPSQNLVSQLEQRLSYSSDPLTEAQSQEMLTILTETSQTARANAAQTGPPALRQGGPLAALTRGVLVTNEAVARAQTVLTTVQLSALQEIQQEQQAAMQLGRTVREELGPPPSGPPPAGEPPP